MELLHFDSVIVVVYKAEHKLQFFHFVLEVLICFRMVIFDLITINFKVVEALVEELQTTQR